MSTLDYVTCVNISNDISSSDVLKPDAHVYWNSRVPWIDSMLLSSNHTNNDNNHEKKFVSLPKYATSRDGAIVED